MKFETGVIVLAAGGARRMGRLKQLLPLQGRPLTYYAVRNAIAARLGVVIVVLGAGARRVRETFVDLPAIPVENHFWETGMASSIKVGLNTLEVLRPKCTAAVVMLTDQPFVSVNLLRRLVIAHQNRDVPLVATRYVHAGAGRRPAFGVPALFSRSYFDEIRELPGDAGAKRVIEKHIDEALFLDDCEAGIDIDTAADSDRLLRDDPRD